VPRRLESISRFENIACHLLIALLSNAVSAINGLYVALGSPKLPGWSASGGDPCGESWQGVTCTGSSITSMYASYSICQLLPVRLFYFVLLSTHCLQSFQCCKFGRTARQPGELHFNNWNVRAWSSQFSLPMVMAVPILMYCLHRWTADTLYTGISYVVPVSHQALWLFAFLSL